MDYSYCCTKQKQLSEIIRVQDWKINFQIKNKIHSQFIVKNSLYNISQNQICWKDMLPHFVLSYIILSCAVTVKVWGFGLVTEFFRHLRFLTTFQANSVSHAVQFTTALTESSGLLSTSPLVLASNSGCSATRVPKLSLCHSHSNFDSQCTWLQFQHINCLHFRWLHPPITPYVLQCTIMLFLTLHYLLYCHHCHWYYDQWSISQAHLWGPLRNICFSFL
jgi:hypothetical protein